MNGKNDLHLCFLIFTNQNQILSLSKVMSQSQCVKLTIFRSYRDELEIVRWQGGHTLFFSRFHV
jgi:hypothetical protein